MSKKSHPGDGDQGKGEKGAPPKYRALFEVSTLQSSKSNKTPETRKNHRALFHDNHR